MNVRSRVSTSSSVTTLRIVRYRCPLAPDITAFSEWVNRRIIPASREELRDGVGAEDHPSPA